MGSLKAALDALDPRLWLVFWALVVGGVVWVLKKTGTWAKLPSRVKVPFGTALGALMTATADVAIDPGAINVAKVLVDAVVGGFSGLTATGGHQLWVRLLSAPQAKTPAAADGGTDG